MRTTLEIDDELLRAAQARAKQRGTTVERVIEDALRRQLDPNGAGRVKPLPTAAESGAGGLLENVEPGRFSGALEHLDEADWVERRGQ